MGCPPTRLHSRAEEDIGSVEKRIQADRECYFSTCVAILNYDCLNACVGDGRSPSITSQLTVPVQCDSYHLYLASAFLSVRLLCVLAVNGTRPTDGPAEAVMVLNSDLFYLFSQQPKLISPGRSVKCPCFCFRPMPIKGRHEIEASPKRICLLESRSLPQLSCSLQGHMQQRQCQIFTKGCLQYASSRLSTPCSSHAIQL